jgi:RNA methyltransferase, TrmH family
MIPIPKLAKLAPRHRMRKAALVLGELERSMLSQAGDLEIRYVRSLAALVASTPEITPRALADAKFLEACCEAEILRAIDRLRHALLSATGQAPADWDLLDPNTGKPDCSSRRIHTGMKAYLEDLRSPFNVGSVFRTADAFGLEELYLSPNTADPRHPRAERSAMGAVDLIAWKRVALNDLGGEQPVFGLELGGNDIDSFEFPERAVAMIGSEELGLSPEARELCTYGIVSIPMSGAKGSLNVAVAFGVLMHAWSHSLDRS